MALPPKPGEVTEGGIPLIWAWVDPARNNTAAKAVKKTTENETEPLTAT